MSSDYVPMLATSQLKQPSQNACLSCRTAKIRCKSSSTREPCERCTRNSLSCVYERHRRGRKPGTRLKRKPVLSVDDVSPLLGVARVHPVPNQLSPQRELVSSPMPHGIQHENDLSSQGGDWGSTGLQPVDILSKDAQSGKFSLGNILCVLNVSEQSQVPRPLLGYNPVASNQDDPIGFKILTFPVALGLFDSFMRCLNPYISQLDPNLHTFDYIRQKSSFLLTTILSTSSKAFHPSLHPALRAHSEKLMGEAFVKGTKSTETVQGLLIFSYWKEPDEMRTWLLVGYAIRMAIELGWHELEPISRATYSGDEFSSREARNIERTWLVLFVYDRSLSLQLGKPWMIEQRGIILKANSWHMHEFAVLGGDLVLASFVALRIVSAELLLLASPSHAVPSNNHGEMLSKILNSGISSWEEDWLPQFDSDTIAPCHRFLANFYCLHLRLLLNSYPLQVSLAARGEGSLISKSALWHCTSSAIGMLEQISIQFGPFKQLYFVQDSIHVMVAYAAIFLIKLLISLPKNIRSDFESSSTQAILKTANTFEQQCATQLTGCAMQARFLKSVIQKYESLKSQAPCENNGDRLTVADNMQASSTTHVPDTATVEPDNNNGAENSPPQSQQIQDILGTNLFADKDLWDTLFSDVEFWMPGGNPLSGTSSLI